MALTIGRLGPSQRNGKALESLPFEQAGEKGKMMAKAIHSMIRVLDETRSLLFYDRAFDLQIADRFEFDGFTLVYLRNEEADFELELTVNRNRSEPYTLGEGYGHLAFATEDLLGEHARLDGLGMKPGPIRELTLNGVRLAQFFFIEDPDGYRVEVIQSHGRYQ